ncbi:MAG TPA: TldD/PmbA family protein [Gemmatimonadaceae bacterium]|nr:TldD/PmbA family protein [Gemmatimonadaceae bacterium]
MTSRRDFLRKTGSAAAIAAVGGTLLPDFANALSAAPVYPRGVSAFEELPIKELLMDAIAAAKSAGATFADARIGRYRQNFVGTREKQIVQVGDTDSIGIGVRALVNGAWGFAASQNLTKDGVAAAAREAATIAKANRLPGSAPVVLAPAQAYPNATWKSTYEIDPFTIPVEQKAQLLIDANTEAMKVANVRFVNSTLFFVREDRSYANTDGSFIQQTVIRSWAPMGITAISSDGSDFQTRANMVQPAGRGWEFVLAADLKGNAPKWGEEAAEKLKAKPVDVGRYDLVLHPSHLWLTIHESIGHPTELDRAMGYEANYAGTSFVAPPEKVLGTLKYGPEFMNIQGDRVQEGGCGTIGWDDDGVKAESFLIIRNGVFHDYQTSREQAPWLESYYKKNGMPVKSHGCCNADNWSSVQFQRMPNVSLLPGEKDLKWEDLIAATDRGIAIVGDGSYSIDQQRYNAQFGGQVFYEIKGGKITGMLKDVAYQMKTTEFWNSMDMIGGKSGYMMGASFFDGKGQPGQVGAVSHGCVPARFRNVNVINTGRKA